MPDTGSGAGDRGGSRTHRREFLQATGAAGVAALSGCIAGSGGGSQTVVQLAADSGAKEIQSDINAALHDAGLPSDIRVEILAGSPDTAQQQYSQWLSAGLKQPSLLRMDNGWTVPFILRDQVANLSEELPKVAERVKNNYFDAAVATAQGRNGDVFGLPFFTDFGLMLYRKDLVKQAGFKPEQENWASSPLTWKRFSNVTKQTKQQTGTTFGFTFQAMVYEGLPCCTFNEFMTSWGGSYFGARKNLFGPVGERPVTVDSQPVVDALRMARTFIAGSGATGSLDGYAGNIAPRDVLQWDEDPSLSQFLNGNAVMHRNWPYSVLEAGADSAFGEKLGVMPMPYGVKPEQAKFDGMGGSKSALGGQNICLNPNARHREPAKQVLRAMSQDSFYLKMLEVIGYVPPKPELLSTDKAKQVPVMGRYAETLKRIGQNAVPRPVTVVWPQESPRIAQQVSAALSGDTEPKRAMAELDRLLNAIEEGV